MRQSWCDLLFAHWRVPAASLRPLLPSALAVEEFDGSAWIGVVPFRMQGVMFRPLPDLPWISAFPELNVRTYVECEGKPGVWFFSLDASNALAVWAARKFFHLPYYPASMSLRSEASGFRYASARSDATGAAFHGTYRPTSAIQTARRGTLEHFLTERYCLYAQSPAGDLWRTEVHHAPWPLQAAAARIETCTVLADTPWLQQSPPELLHFSRRIDVVAWRPRRVTG